MQRTINRINQSQPLADARRDGARTDPLRSSRRGVQKRVKRITDDMVSQALRDPEIQCRLDLAKRLGVCLESVDRHLKVMEIYLPRTIIHKPRQHTFVKGHAAWNKDTGITEEQYREAHGLKLSEPQAADYLNCSQALIDRKWKEYGLKAHGKANPAYRKGLGFLTDELVDDLCSAYAQGLMARDVARQFNITQENVIKVWKEYGFTEYVNGISGNIG